MASRAPVYILNQNAKREQGRKAQTANIKAARVSFQKGITPNSQIGSE